MLFRLHIHEVSKLKVSHFVDVRSLEVVVTNLSIYDLRLSWRQCIRKSSGAISLISVELVSPRSPLSALGRTIRAGKNDNFLCVYIFTRRNYN
jgi:hypothetical protein